ncbi:hypothetical protein [Ornithinimicrobium sp. INDO-MA30-4]|uniref:hypothetical protein n=1 Tax=Ornithinimicrobium sp. INDO-MA30-4 TaxID=2908651 RepID=UPI001F44FBB9|nr:hypothetical protein [Ornithinimicrobium sp. INDO-MA30-4]UJH71110.1 hypothetical protein L0A91_04370 [Ornithinimicrobium sp. INDO-MA30-4]
MSEPAAGAIALPAGAAVLDVDIAWETETSDDGPTGVIDEVAFYADVLIEEQGVAPDQALSEALSDILGTGGGQQPTVSMQVLEPASGLTHEVALADFAIADDFSRSEGGEVDLDTSTKTAQISIPLPAEGDYQIIGLSVTTSAFLPGVTRTATVTPSVDGEPLSVAPSVESWSSTRDSESELTANTEGELSLVVPLDSTIPDASGQARVSFSGLSVPQALPLALTSSLAETNSLDLGSLVEVQVAGSVVNGQVSALVDAVPGVKSADAILVDAGTLSQAIWAQDQALGYPDELWISATVPTEVAAEVSQIDGISETRDFSAESAVDAAQPVREVFWIAAAGSVLLAGVGVGAASASLSASRRSEVAVLRALGMAASRQARSRALELFAVIGLALFGAAAGWLVSVVVVPVLAQATLVAGQATVPASLQLDVASWSALLGLQAVLLVLVIARVAQKVARQARDASYREEVR